jgi:hypothetical protein
MVAIFFHSSQKHEALLAMTVCNSSWQAEQQRKLEEQKKALKRQKLVLEKEKKENANKPAQMGIGESCCILTRCTHKTVFRSGLFKPHCTKATRVGKFADNIWWVASTTSSIFGDILQAFGGLAEMIDNSYDANAKAVHVRSDKTMWNTPVQSTPIDALLQYSFVCCRGM